MADWCKDEYRVRCTDEAALRRAHDILLEAGGVFSTPLSELMDRLGFDGDRSGLTEGSVLSGLTWTPGRDGNGSEVYFVVDDNFSDFDPARALVEAVGVPMSFSFRFTFEDAGIRNSSGWMKAESEYVPRSELIREAGEIIRGIKGVRGVGEDGVAELLMDQPFDALDVVAVGPGRDEVRLVGSPVLTGVPVEKSLHLSDVGDVSVLERILVILRFEQEYERYVQNVGMERIADNLRRGYVYGKDGFTARYLLPEPRPVTMEDAVSYAASCPDAEGNPVDLSGEVAEEMRGGASYREAFREWDIEDPWPDGLVRGRDCVSFAYCDKEMFRFEKAGGDGFMLHFGDRDAYDAFVAVSGIDLLSGGMLGEGFVGDRRMEAAAADLVHRVMLAEWKTVGKELGALSEEAFVDQSVQWFSSLDAERQRSVLEILVTMNSTSPYGRLMLQEGLDNGKSPLELFSDLDAGDMRTAVQVDRRISEGDPALTGEETGPEKDIAPESVGEPDVRAEREKMLGELYGSSVAYQNVSSFMRGFDIVYDSYRECAVSMREALDRAREHGLYDEVYGALAGGASIAEAMREWDLDDPDQDYVDREILDFRYDGDLMLAFTRDAGERFWKLDFFDGQLLDSFVAETGIMLSERLGLDEGSYNACFTTKSLLDTAREAVLSSVNRDEVRDAEVRCRWRMKQREMKSRLDAARPCKVDSVRRRKP